MEIIEKFLQMFTVYTLNVIVMGNLELIYEYNMY